MRERGLTAQHGLIEKDCGARTEPPRFEVASFVKEKESLVQIKEPWPDKIPFAGEHFASLREPFEGLHSFSLLAVRDGLVCERLRGFVTQAEFFEAHKAFVGHFTRFFTQVQLQINVREIEMAK